MIGADVDRGDGAVANATAGALESVCSVAQLAARNATTSNTEARETRGNNRRISPFLPQSSDFECANSYGLPVPAGPTGWSGGGQLRIYDRRAKTRSPCMSSCQAARQKPPPSATTMRTAAKITTASILSRP